jgi:exodeoxyribonuclease V beta subunit
MSSAHTHGRQDDASLQAFDVREHPLVAGVHLLEASAGTGKTYSITGLILRLLTEGVDGERLLLSDILVVTFTRAATAELKERIQSRLAAAAQSLRQRERWVQGGRQGDAPLEADSLLAYLCDKAESEGEVRLTEWRQWLTTARANIDTAPISTIHSFCQRVLTANSFDTGAIGGRTVLLNTDEIVSACTRDWHVRTLTMLRLQLGDDADAILREAKKSLAHHSNSTAGLEGLVANRVRALVNEGPTAPALPDYAAVDITARIAGVLAMAAELDAALQAGIDELSYNAMVDFVAATLCAKNGNVKQKKGFYTGLGRQAAPTDTDAASFVDYVFSGHRDPSTTEERVRRGLMWHSQWGQVLLLRDAAKGVSGATITEDGYELSPEAMEAWLYYAKSPFARNVDAIVSRHGVEGPLDAFVPLGRQLAGAGVQDACLWTRREFDRRMSVPSNAMIHELATALKSGSGAGLVEQLRKTYRCALIDEFQDTDTAQWSIFEAMYGIENGSSQGMVFLIGDPKQAIYEFRGANIHAYLAAKAESTPALRRTLDTNYRSDGELVRAMNEMLGHSGRDVFGASGISYLQVNASHTERYLQENGRRLKPVVVVDAQFPEGSEKEFAKDLPNAMIRLAVGRIRELHASDTMLCAKDGTGRSVQFGDMAVLCDSNHNADRMFDALTRANIPAMRWSDESVFSSREARELYELLGALASTDRQALRSFAASRLGGASASELAGWDADVASTGVKWMGLLDDARSRLLKRGYAASISEVLRKTEALERLSRYEDGERALANTQQILELIQGAAGVGAQQQNATVVREWLGARIVAALRGDSDEESTAQTRLERDKDSVAVLTIHKSKGLEFPFVLLPFLQTAKIVAGRVSKSNAPELRELDDQEKEWLLTRPVNTTQWDGDTPAPGFEGLTWDLWSELRRMEGTRERLRQLYVAVTRASRQLVVFNYPGSASGDSNSLFHALFYPADTANLIADTKAYRVIQGRLHGELSDLVECVPVYDDGRWPAPMPLAASSIVDISALPRPRVRVDNAWKIGSYSGISPDHISLAVEGDARVTGETDAADDTAIMGSGIVGFWAGTKAGSFLHRLYELADFTALVSDDAQVQESAARALSAMVGDEAMRHGFNPQSFDTGTLCQDFVRTLRHGLGGPLGAGSLGDVARGDRQDEAPFLLKASRVGAGVSASHILEIMFAYEPTVFTSAYRDAVQAMDKRALERTFHGLLTGFIDLVFRAEVDGQVQYFVLDYKSNRLHERTGTSARTAMLAYDPSGVERAMSEHHYYLQYHLYILALHRWLALRVPGYELASPHSYQRFVGGAYYTFVRGMALAGHVGAAPGTAVFFHRPKFETIHALDRLFDGQGAGVNA